MAPSRVINRSLSLACFFLISQIDCLRCLSKHLLVEESAVDEKVRTNPAMGKFFLVCAEKT